MDFEEDQEEQDEEMEITEDQPPQLPQLPYGLPPVTNSSPTSAQKPSSAGVRYCECQKNHAVGIGGSAVDGCGEFMAAGEEGSLDALRCAACNCHRNFHRKVTAAEASAGGIIYPSPPSHHHYHHYGPGPFQFSPYYRAAPAPSGYLQLTAGPSTQRQLALPAAGGPTSSREDVEDYVSNNPGSSGGSGSMKKRFRTKFTQEQKDRMLEFAEPLGWRIQKHDDPAVEEFCIENGIRRHVLKVWMHNNKHTLGKKS